MLALSVIVPVYNTEKYLSECIESILRQTFTDFELILVDDGSTDHSGTICNQYAEKDQRIRVIHKINGGAISARQTGLAAAKGTWVAFCDSDDWMKPDSLQTLMNGCVMDDEIEIIVGAYILEEKGRFQKQFDFSHTYIYKSPEEALIDLFQSRYFNWSLCGKLYKKSLLEEILYKWAIQGDMGEDTEASWRLFLNARKIAYIPTQGYVYRAHGDSMTHQPFSLARLSYLDRLIYIMESMDCYSFILQASVAKLYFQWGSRYMFEMLRLSLGNSELFDKYQFYLKKSMEKMIYHPSLREQRITTLLLKAYPDAIQWLSTHTISMRKMCEGFYSQNERVLIYGAGIVANKVFTFLREHGYAIDGFVITKAPQETERHGYPVISLEMFWQRYGKTAGLILAMNEQHTAEVMDILSERGITRYLDLGSIVI